MNFWTQYVIAKERQGVDKDTSLNKIEQRFDTQFRDQIEDEYNEWKQNNPQ